MWTDIIGSLGHVGGAVDGLYFEMSNCECEYKCFYWERQNDSRRKAD